LTYELSSPPGGEAKPSLIQVTCTIRAYPRIAKTCDTTGRWSSKLPNIKEENHLLVDRSVSELKTRGDRRHSAIVLCYVYGARDIDIAKELKCSKASAREARIAGENWLDAKVEIDQDSL
jgi:hypothetical protein